jgi:pyruvate-formate lyase-activating enzyme
MNQPIRNQNDATVSGTARPGCRPPRFELDGELVDALDLKTLLITHGINVPDEIFARFGRTHRLAPSSNPFACNCLLLPGGIPAHLFHIGPAADFSLTINEAGRPWLTHRGRPVTEVNFPPASNFYEQRTSTGAPFGQMAVLQGVDVLSFPFLWLCQFALGGLPCHYCYQGNISLAMHQAGQPLPVNPTPEEVAEVVEYAVRREGMRDVQLTGGSLVGSTQGELPLLVAVLEAIDRRLGLAAIPGEIYAYTSAPKEPEAVDEVFAAGADHVAFDLDVWDEELWRRICPGIARHIGRPQQLRALDYAARRHGPNKVCTAFVVGLEPVDSLLAGAEYVAQRGIVPLFSIWMPHQRPVLGSTTPPGLDYYRRARAGFRELFVKYNLKPPGASGLNVCLCRDLVNGAAD